jgi:ABC-type polysaccharide/polyol phosphate transport system ATPase subunit
MVSVPPTQPNPDAPVVIVDGVWKRFVRNEHRPSLRHEAQAMVKRLLRRAVSQTPVEPFYALRDVSFRVQRGEAVGIVGRNGSGKTTLLKLLSGITRPTRGEIHVAGHFATLIGLTAGFNAERTGRENIYLNAAIQGVPPHRVREILGEIVAFAELEQFIDTPVKLYSSGMVARLGFSIAVHILPEIIFLDEVLAVGDSAFQEKCVQRILELKHQGRTLLFVSHAHGHVQMLCERTLWLHNGALMADGPTADVLAEYEHALFNPPQA